MSVMIEKCSQPTPAALSGGASEKLIAVNMPPRTPTMSTIKSSAKAIIPALERR